MGQKFKIRILLLLSLVTILFVNCEREDINSNENQNSFKISSRRATVNEVLHKINSSSIKQKIMYENNRIIGKDNNINSSQHLRLNHQDSIFTVIEKENDFTTYLLPISSYTTENPFFLKFIITVDVNTVEKSGYIKYIPSAPTGTLSLKTFSGIVEVYNIGDELIGLTTFVNGIAQPQTSNSNNNRVICYDQVTINEVTCSHGGGHGVGESCNEGYINDAFWYVSITTVCNYDPTTIVQIIDDSSNPSSGGGSSNLNPNTAILNKIIDNLTMAQLDWWYSQNTSQATKDAIVNYVKQNNTNEDDFNEAIDFVKEAIDALMNDAEVNFDDEIIYAINKPCQNEIIKDVMNVSSPFTNLINQTFNVNDKANVKFNNGSIPGGNAYTNPFFYGNSNNFTISIRFEDTFLESSTNLGIAAVTLHELVHAYFIKLYLKGELTATSQSYEDLLNAFIAFYDNQVQDTFDALDNELHNAMKDFIDKMGNSLYNYAINNNIDVTADYCINLAWGTMTGTELFENALTPQQQLTCNNIYAYEQDSLPQASGTPCN